MLPITTRRSFHVPHTLAVAAALVALIAAFGSTASDPAALTRHNTDIGIEAVASADGAAAAADRPESAVVTLPSRDSACGGRDHCLRDHSAGLLPLGLLPLVLPSLPTR